MGSSHSSTSPSPNFTEASPPSSAEKSPIQESCEEPNAIAVRTGQMNSPPRLENERGSPPPDTPAEVTSTKNGVAVNTGENSNAMANRVNLTSDELCSANVSVASTLSLLRLRERNLYATCHRLFRCLHPEYNSSFAYTSKEGNGTEEIRIRNLNFAIHLLSERVTELTKEYDSNSAAKRRLNRARRSSGDLVKTQKATMRAVASELALRKDEIDSIVRSLSFESSGIRQVGEQVSKIVSPLPAMVLAPNLENCISNNEFGASHPISGPSAMASNEVEMEKEWRRHRDMDMEDAGIRKPSVNEKLIAARTRAYQIGNVEGVQSAESRIAKRQATSRRARHRHKARKRELRKYCRELELKNRVPDPRSDDDDNAPVA